MPSGLLGSSRKHRASHFLDADPGLKDWMKEQLEAWRQKVLSAEEEQRELRRADRSAGSGDAAQGSGRLQHGGVGIRDEGLALSSRHPLACHQRPSTSIPLAHNNPLPR